MRLAFAGTPEFAQRALERLTQAGLDVVLVLTQPDRPAGRGMKLQASPVKQYALSHAMPVAQPRSLRLDGKYPDDAAAARQALLAARPDAMVVAAYGLILPQWVLDLPRLGCLNIHASLLPRWRGAGPIQAAILAGDAETGITIMRMEEGLDTGPMLLREATPIGPRMTTPEVHDALAAIGARLILRALDENPATMQQPETGVTYAPKIAKEDGRLDWTQPAEALDRRIRALTPWPGCFFHHGTEVIRVLAAEPTEGQGTPGTVLDAPARAGGESGPVTACGTGALRLLRLQRAGRAALPAPDFLRGYALPPGGVVG